MFSRSPKQFFFQFIFLFINFFIFIGEATKQIVLSPFFIIKLVYRSIKKISFKRVVIKKPSRNKTRSKIWAFISKKTKILFKKIRKTAGKLGKSIKLFLWFLLKGIGRVIKNTLLLIVFIIKAPFRFIASLLTPQVKFLILGIAITALFFIGQGLHQFVVDLPSPKDIGKVNYSLATHLYDRNGKLLYEIYHDQKRTPIKLAELPKFIYQASIAIEDKDYYTHKGISLVSGILRAVRETVFKGSLQGGSTITQQLVKTALLSPERTLERKAKEMILALWTEQTYSKDQILQMYLNQVSYGGAAYGIQEAAKTYFDKDAKDLSIAEAALLAGLPQAPSVYSPFVNPDLAIARRNDVLKKMNEQKYITDSEYQAAKATPLEIVQPGENIKAPHFVFYVKGQLEKEYGTRMVEQGGLNVKTSLDLDVQQKAEEILKAEVARQGYLNVKNGAILVTKPATGEIVAMVGSADYFSQPYGAFNVTNAARQPGSSLKPFIYALGIEKGIFTSATMFDDVATQFGGNGSEVYRPINYDGKFHGRVTLRNSLANSYNIPAVKALSIVSINNFVPYMQSMGISTWNDPGRYVLPMALGGVEVKMVDEASAYGVLASGGYKVPLSGVISLKDSNDSSLFQLNPDKTRILSEGTTYIISSVLSDNQARQATFGPGSQLEIPGYKVAVKTGTTDSKKDNWTFGYTPEYMVAVWIGNNDSSPMSQSIESGITGAAPIWHQVMEYLLKNKSQHPNEWYPKPENVVEKNCFGKPEYFIAGTENTVACAAPTPVPVRPTVPAQQLQQQQTTVGVPQKRQYFNNQKQ